MSASDGAHSMATTQQPSPGGSKTHGFVSFDTEHDQPLYELLLAQSRTPDSAFGVRGRSERLSSDEVWGDQARRRICKADQVVVICGEHTEASMGVFSELRLAQEEKKPYFLLWGRPGIMCTKPAGAKSAEGMYSWTKEILEHQLAVNLR